ncbi:endospore germination permease [Cytobacillus sp. FJAT-53684]|uniref:Endospore germination permease n=1 Tax=Cytobacillus mangrovibacter TaxID=3299024 RepID=A0ABW6K2M1_9BACI
MNISVKQFTILVVMYTWGSAVLLIPSALATFAKSNAWISSLLGLLFGLLLIFLYVKISAVYPDKTFIELNRVVFGRWIGTIISILILFPIFLLSAGILREIGDFFTTQVIIETPIEVIHIFTLITAIYCIRAGLEVISRTCEIFFPWIVLFLIILIIFLIPEMEIRNISPNFARGIGPILGAAYPYISIPYCQLVVFLMILPNVNNASKARKSFFLGVILGSLGITLITIMCLGVLGHDFTSRNMYPTYVLGKMVKIGGIIERVEVLVAISWILSTFFKFVVSSYALLLGIAQVLKLNDYRVLVFPISFLLLVYSMVSYPNIVYFMEVIYKMWTPYALTVFGLLPLFVLIAANVKKKISN